MTVRRSADGITFATAFAAMALAAAGPVRADDAARGRALFAPCGACHAREAGKPGLAGPHLAALKGRTVGGAEDFDYSPALKRARRDGEIWDEAKLLRFLESPDEMFPGLWMSAQPIGDEADRRALAAYLLGDPP